MSSFRFTRRWALAGAAAAISVVAAAPAQAAPIVHQTPAVPIVVDGVQYAPEQIYLFDGQPLYMRLGKDGKTLVAYTKLARAKAFLRKQGITLPTPGKRVTPKAKSSASGHWTKFCTDRFEQGWCYQINSGWGLANVRALNGCNPWVCWLYDNNIESMRVHGPGAVIFDLPNFNPAGGFFYLYDNEVIDLTYYGWGNRLESLYQPW